MSNFHTIHDKLSVDFLRTWMETTQRIVSLNTGGTFDSLHHFPAIRGGGHVIGWVFKPHMSPQTCRQRRWTMVVTLSPGCFSPKPVTPAHCVGKVQSPPNCLFTKAGH